MHWALRLRTVPVHVRFLQQSFYWRDVLRTVGEGVSTSAQCYAWRASQAVIFGHPALSPARPLLSLIEMPIYIYKNILLRTCVCPANVFIGWTKSRPNIADSEQFNWPGDILSSVWTRLYVTFCHVVS